MGGGGNHLYAAKCSQPVRLPLHYRVYGKNRILIDYQEAKWVISKPQIRHPQICNHEKILTLEGDHQIQVWCFNAQEPELRRVSSVRFVDLRKTPRVELPR